MNLNDIMYSTYTPAVCYTLLAIMVAGCVLAFHLEISHSYVRKCAMSELIKMVQDGSRSGHHYIAKMLLSNMVSDEAVRTKEVSKSQSWFIKESSERELSAKQQLVLMDQLLGSKTNLRQAEKIVRVRTTRDIIRLAASAIANGDIKTAPVVLFH